MKNLVLGIVLGALASAVSAAPTSPYRGQEGRAIKALSTQEIDDYLNGRGMGYAKAAELNHYPGPRHVLDLAREIALTDAQITQTRAIFGRMQADAIALGTQLVDKEQALDALFATGSAKPATLQALLAEIGALQARIRYVHLHAHLEQRRLLTPDQIVRYDQLRGYATPDHRGRTHDHGHGHAH